MSIMELKMPLFTVFSEQSERYLTFFAYLCSRRLHYRCMDRQNAYILIGVTTLILTPKFATWK